MSKIFEALTRVPNGISEGLLEPLFEEQADAKRTVGQPAVNPAVKPAVKPAGKPAPQEDAIPGPGLGAVRTCTLRVAPLSPILPFDGSHWRAGEQYRILRTRIIQHVKQPRMVVVTSAGPNDGKTVTVINLAGALALKSEARVLLLDGDFRRSTVCTKLGIPETLGIANVLQGDCPLADALVRTEQIPNLYILPAGKARVNPTELLGSSQWATLVAVCRANFEYIMVDSPPLGAVADYDIIQAACDAIVLVVRPDHTQRQMCLQALQAIPKDKLMGVILNCVQGWLADRQHRSYDSYYRCDRRPELTVKG